MKNITGAFDHIYLPQKALIVYRSVSQTDEVYIEAYDMDDMGCPINAHPLSLNETAALTECLNASTELRNDFLTSKGLLPENVLYIQSHNMGYAVWYTAAQKAKLYFKKELSIDSGEAHIPALVWKATKDTLEVYALQTDKRPNIKTPLCYAPFFNIYENGKVCMGTVETDIDNNSCLEDFIGSWQHYFFNSYFSHMISGHSPVKGNIVQLWKSLTGTNKRFPTEVLVKNGRTLKQLIV